MRNFLFLLLMGAMLMFTLKLCYGQTHIGVNYGSIAGEDAWGITADTSNEIAGVEINLDGTAQGGGSVTWGRWHAEAIVPISVFGLKIFVDGLFKKYEGQETGQNRDAGAAIQLPSFVEGLDIGIGVFGRNSNPFGAPNALDDLEGIGYNRNDFDGLGLENISPPPTGLSIQPSGNYLNMLIYANWDLNEDWSLKARAMPQLTGEDKVHQLILSPQVSYDLNNKVNLVIGGDIAFQTFGDMIEKELAIFTSLSLEL